jgi:hypothetical protein
LENRKEVLDVAEKSQRGSEARMRYFGTVLIIVAYATTCVFSNAQESPSSAEEQPSVSPDKRWEYKGTEIINAATKQVVLDLDKELDLYGPKMGIVWAPDSKRFGFNYGPLTAHHTTYQKVRFTSYVVTNG